jgi:hypothetical protein
MATERARSQCRERLELVAGSAPVGRGWPPFVLTSRSPTSQVLARMRLTPAAGKDELGNYAGVPANLSSSRLRKSHSRMPPWAGSTDVCDPYTRRRPNRQARPLPLRTKRSSLDGGLPRPTRDASFSSGPRASEAVIRLSSAVASPPSSSAAICFGFPDSSGASCVSTGGHVCPQAATHNDVPWGRGCPMPGRDTPTRRRPSGFTRSRMSGPRALGPPTARCIHRRRKGSSGAPHLLRAFQLRRVRGSDAVSRLVSRGARSGSPSAPTLPARSSARGVMPGTGSPPGSPGSSGDA